MQRALRFFSVVVLSIIVAGSFNFTLSQADSPVIRGTAAASASSQVIAAPSISSRTSDVQIDPSVTPTPTTPAFYIVSVTMAKGVQGQDNSPVNPTSIFSATDTFHAVVMIQDAPLNTNFTSIWYAVDVGSAAQPNTVIDTAQVLTDGTRNIDFSLMPQANSSWPTGIYSVEIDVNGTKAADMYFTVQ